MAEINFGKSTKIEITPTKRDDYESYNRFCARQLDESRYHHERDKSKKRLLAMFAIILVVSGLAFCAFNGLIGFSVSEPEIVDEPISVVSDAPSEPMINEMPEMNKAPIMQEEPLEVQDDTTPPQVNITSPLSNSVLTNRTITINLTVSDSNLNYTNVSIKNSAGAVVNFTILPYSGSSAVDNYVWVANQQSDKVSKINKTTNAVVANITVGSNPNGIAVDEKFVWIIVPGSNMVKKINKTSHVVETNITVGSSPSSVAVDDKFAWVVNSGSNTVSKINKTNDTVIATISVGSMGGGGRVAVDDQFVWVTGYNSGVLTQINKTNDTVINTTSGFAKLAGMSVDSNYVWMTNVDAGSNAVYRVNKTSKSSTTAGVAHARGIAADYDFAWACATWDHNLVKINKTNNAIVNSIPVTGGQYDPYDISIDSDSVWLANYNGGRYVARVNKTNDTVAAYIDIGTNMYPTFNGDGTGYAYDMFFSQSGSSNLYTATLTVPSDGTYNITATAYDIAGNDNSSTVEVIVNTATANLPIDLVWNITSSISSGNDVAYGTCADATGVYIGGHENSLGNQEWRIEKRSLTDGSLIWNVSSNPSSGDDIINAITCDGTGVYAVGLEFDGFGSNRWRIEKRNLTDGSLIWSQIPDFSGDDKATAVTLDSTGLYVAGVDGSAGYFEVIQKRYLNNGSLIWSVNNGGLGLSNNWPWGMTFYGDAIYVVGQQRVGSYDRHRIEKRYPNNGSIIWSLDYDPEPNNHGTLYGVAADDSGLYVSGSQGYNAPWQDDKMSLQKRYLNNGSLIWNISSNLGSGKDDSRSLAIDDGALYVARTESPINYSDIYWRIEKRDLNNGSLTANYSLNPSYGTDMPYSMYLYSNRLYAVGQQYTPSNSNDWFIAKFSLAENILVVSSNFTVTAPAGATFANDSSNNTIISNAFGTPIVLFPFNTTGAATVNVSTTSAGGGMVIVNGANLPAGTNKTIFIPKITNGGYVCINDNEGVSSISAKCNGANEIVMKCPGSSGSYSCVLGNGYYNVSGLAHSGGGETNDTIFPVLNFTSPTPENGTMTSNPSIEINVTIEEQNLDSFKFNWNGTNYSVYDPSLVFAMNFNNNSAIGENRTYAVDISRSSKNGTLQNHAYYISSGKYGSAISVDGLDDYVFVSAQMPLVNISVGMWFKTTDSRTTQNLMFSRWYSSYQDPLRIRMQSGNITCSVEKPISIGGICNTNQLSGYNDSAWHQVYCVRNSTDLIIYLDGLFKNSVACVGNGSQDSDFAIGKNPHVGGEAFNGTIDEVRIYNRTLSADEIAKTYNIEFAKYNSTRWTLYDNISNLTTGNYTYYAWANDTSGNSNSTETRTIAIGEAPPAGEDTNISSGPRTLNSANTVYILNQSINCSGTCLIINATNITIEGMGNNLTGNSTGYGIYDNGYDNLTVNNCTVQNFSMGIYLNGGADSGRITNNLVNSNGENGIYMASSSNNLLFNNSANKNSHGIRLVGSSNNNLTQNTANNNNQYGIILYSSSNSNNLTQNNLNSNNGAGIYISDSSNNNLISNVIGSNLSGGVGIQLNSLGSGSSNNQFIGNVIIRNSSACAESATCTDLYSDSSSNNNNVFINTTFNSSNYPTTASFAYNGVIIVNSANAIASPGYHNVSKYLSITNSSAAWVLLNISYDEPSFNDSDLKMYRYNGSDLELVAGLNGVDTVNNVVYANITKFSIFTILEEMLPEDTNISYCRYLNLNDTTYALNQSINSSGTCLTFNATNVTIDCQGNMINYSQTSAGYGINVTGFNYATIKNCTIVQGADNANSSAMMLKDSFYSAVIHNNITTYPSSNMGPPMPGASPTVPLTIKSSNHSIIHSNIFTAPGNMSSYALSLEGGSENNTLYNNKFSSYLTDPGMPPVNLEMGSKFNNWNITETLGINIMNGSNLGGNYYSGVQGGSEGFSDTCEDFDNDGICDSSYPLNLMDNENIDYLPLAASDAANNTNITECRALGHANSVYHVLNNLTSNSTCLTIDAANITLDCGGNTINYSQEYTGEGIMIKSSNNTIKNCIITQSAGTGDAISMDMAGFGNIIENNTLITDSSPCMNLMAGRNKIWNNTIYSSDNHGIIFSSEYNIVSNNNITAYSPSGNAISFEPFGKNNNISDNNLVSLGSSIRIGNGAANNTFRNNRLVTNNTYINFNFNSIPGNKIENTTFAGINGSIRFPDEIELPELKNISISNLNITYNRTFLNSSDTDPQNISFLNRPAVITLNGLNNNNPSIKVAYNDTDFEDCTECSVLSSGTDVVFNVSHFTTYIVQEGPAAGENLTCGVLNEANKTYYLNNSVNSSGTCFTVMAENVTLDCQGYSINHSRNSQGFGIIANGFNHSTIKNCRIDQNWTGNPGTSGVGINLQSSKDHNVINNTITMSGTGIAYSKGISVSSVFDSNFENNTIPLSSQTSSSGIYLASNSRNNIFKGNVVSATSSSNSALSINGPSTIDNLFVNNTFSTTLTSAIGIYSGCINVTLMNNTIISTRSATVSISSGNDNMTLIGNRITNNAGQYQTYHAISLSSNNNLLKNNIITANSEGHGIYLNGGSNNTLIGNVISNLYVAGRAVYLSSASSNNLTENNLTSPGGAIDFIASSRNVLVNNNLSGINNGYSVYLSGGGYNTFIRNIISAAGTGYGIYSYSSSNSRFIENTLKTAGSDFFSNSSINNSITNMTFNSSSYPTAASFIYAGNITLSSANAPADSGLHNVSKYLSITNRSAAWVLLNISYSDESNESLLKMYRNNGTEWELVPNSGVDEVTNVVYANITKFSTFAPMFEILEVGANAPVNFTAVLAPNKQDVTLNWSMVPDADGYIVFYDDNVTKIQRLNSSDHSGTANMTLIGSSNNSWIDKTANTTQRRFYALAAYKSSTLNFTENRTGKFDLLIHNETGGVGQTMLSVPLIDYSSLDNIISNTNDWAMVYSVNDTGNEEWLYSHFETGAWQGTINSLQQGKGYYFDNFNEDTNITNVGIVPTGNVTQTIRNETGEIGQTLLGVSLKSEMLQSLVPNTNDWSMVYTVNDNENEGWNLAYYESGSSGWHGAINALQPGKGYYFDNFNEDRNMTYWSNPY